MDCHSVMKLVRPGTSATSGGAFGMRASAVPPSRISVQAQRPARARYSTLHSGYSCSVEVPWRQYVQLRVAVGGTRDPSQRLET